MNESNSWETQLRSWTPRRPSAGLKARLFARRGDVGRERPVAFGWWAPAAVCLLLLFVTFNQRDGQLARMAASNQVPLMAVTWSNMSFAAYLPGSFVNHQNPVRPDTFEWTNQGHSPSSMASFPEFQTNYLKR